MIHFQALIDFDERNMILIDKKIWETRCQFNTKSRKLLKKSSTLFHFTSSTKFDKFDIGKSNHVNTQYRPGNDTEMENPI